MYWTEWQSFGVGEWAVVLFGIAASIWGLYIMWWLIAGVIGAFLAFAGQAEASRIFWRWFSRVTPGG